MREIIDIYGKTIFQILILTVLLVILFENVTDGEGNRGMRAIISSHIEQQVENTPDFDKLSAESEKDPPRFTTELATSLYTGEYQIRDILKAWDYMGNELMVHIVNVYAPDGEEQEKELKFYLPGVYEIRAVAWDKENRVRYCTIKVPVNVL